MKRSFLLSIAAIFLCSSARAVENLSGWNLRIGSLNGGQTYDLEGEGFTASSGVARGNGLSVETIGFISKGTYRFKGLNFNSSVSSAAGLSPGEVNRSLQLLRATKIWPFQAAPPLIGGIQYLSNFNYELGAEYRERSSTATLPNQFIPEFQTFSFRAGILSRAPLHKLWSLETEFGILIPIFRDERSQKTGYPLFSVQPDLKIQFTYKVNDFIDFSAGGLVLWEQNYYSGGGSRGVTNAKETYTDFLIPIELRFQF